MKQNIKLIIERGKVWELSDLPEKSIAIDGSVSGPAIDNKRKVYSFDHHGNCVRHASSASCVQVLDAILLGLDTEGYNLYINDIDHDTVLATLLLLQPELANNPKVQDIVRTLGLIDAHGPSYPFQQKNQKYIMVFDAFVMDSYNRAKKEKKYGETDLEELLFDCINKFHKMLAGDFDNIALPEAIASYELIPGTGESWIMAKSSDFIFNKLYADGYKVAITWDLQTDGSYSYTISKKSEFIDFPVKEIIAHLNSIETGWGGGSTIGGAPRNHDGSRSKIEPEKLIAIIKNYLSSKE